MSKTPAWKDKRFWFNLARSIFLVLFWAGFLIGLFSTPYTRVWWIGIILATGSLVMFPFVVYFLAEDEEGETDG